MKVVITGATGSIGRKVLDQCLWHPRITSVVVILRREPPPDFPLHGKISIVINPDFDKWTKDVLGQINDAKAMIWTIGTYDGDVAINRTYPLAFQRSFVESTKPPARGHRFRHVHLGGKLSVPEQDKVLWFMSEARKVKGLFETEAAAFAKEHADRWETFIARPGGVLSPDHASTTLLNPLMGKDWVIRADELAAAMVDIAVNGFDLGPIVSNRELAARGSKVLEELNSRRT